MVNVNKLKKNSDNDYEMAKAMSKIKYCIDNKIFDKDMEDFAKKINNVLSVKVIYFKSKKKFNEYKSKILDNKMSFLNLKDVKIKKIRIDDKNGIYIFYSYFKLKNKFLFLELSDGYYIYKVMNSKKIDVRRAYVFDPKNYYKSFIILNLIFDDFINGKVLYNHKNIDKFFSISPNDFIVKIEGKNFFKKDILNYFRAKKIQKFRRKEIFYRQLDEFVLYKLLANKEVLNLSDKDIETYIRKFIASNWMYINYNNFLKDVKVNDKKLKKVYEKMVKKITKSKFVYLVFSDYENASKVYSTIGNEKDFYKYAQKHSFRRQYIPFVSKKSKWYGPFPKYVGLKKGTLLPIFKYNDSYVIAIVNDTKQFYEFNYKTYKKIFVKKVALYTFLDQVLADWKNHNNLILESEALEIIKNEMNNMKKEWEIFNDVKK